VGALPFLREAPTFFVLNWLRDRLLKFLSDIRVIAGDLVGQTPHGLPQNRSQQKKWSGDIRARLTEWVKAKTFPYLQEHLSKTNSSATDFATEHKINIACRQIGEGNGYVAPSVQIDFGARSTGEPWNPSSRNRRRRNIGSHYGEVYSNRGPRK
jgi:hypothetical protein